MRKLIVSTYTTLDGVFDNLGDWHFSAFSPEMGAFAYAQLYEADALLMGRRTYEIFAASWPSITDEEGFADRMNSIEKYVVSRTLTRATWNNSRIIKGDVVQAVSGLKDAPGHSILLYGSATLMRALIRANLVDEIRVWVHPFVLGEGARLFENDIRDTPLRLTSTKGFDSGVVVLSYATALEVASSGQQAATAA
jgi:dihydrofolate reductase